VWTVKSTPKEARVGKVAQATTLKPSVVRKGGAPTTLAATTTRVAMATTVVVVVLEITTKLVLVVPAHCVQACSTRSIKTNQHQAN